MEPIELMGGYYKVNEAADILRLSKLSVYRAVNKGRLRAVRSWTRTSTRLARILARTWRKPLNQAAHRPV
jgi:excisionase family DNA binding protein